MFAFFSLRNSNTVGMKAAAQEHESVLKNITEEHTSLKELVGTVKATVIDLTTALEKYLKVRINNFAGLCDNIYL